MVIKCKDSLLLSLDARFHLEIVIFGQQGLARLPVVQLGRVVPQQAVLAARPQEDGELVHAAALLRMRGDTGGDPDTGSLTLIWNQNEKQVSEVEVTLGLVRAVLTSGTP